LKDILKGTRFDLDDSDRARMKMEKLVLVSLAGIQAQRRFRPSSIRSWHAQADYHSAINMLSYFAPNPAELAAYFKLLRIRVDLLFDVPYKWAQVEALAASLLERHTLPNKTSSERVVPFHNKTKQCLQEWIAVRGKRDFDFLFVGPSGRPMSSATLRNLLNRLFKVAIQRWCFHRLRHVAASTLHRGGADGITVMNTFGWRSPTVMEGYTEVRSAQLRESYDCAFRKQEEHSAGSVTTCSMGEFFANEKLAPTSNSK
jgi:hypothetical protein